MNRALAIVILIGRSKLVPDFVLSLHLIHLIISIFYTGEIPRNTAWWLSMAGASVICITLATWGCRYRELKPISFGGIGGGTAGAGGSSQGTSGGSGRGGDDGGDGDNGPGLDGDEEQGFSRGRGRGRGRDGAGEYEMVKMNGDAVK